MTAYAVFIKEKTLDQQELDIYAQKMPALLAQLPVAVCRPTVEAKCS